MNCDLPEMEACRHLVQFNMADVYLQASRIVENVLQKKGAPKSLVLENSKIKNKKKLYALVCESIKCKK